jgi:hypothetical protein
MDDRQAPNQRIQKAIDDAKLLFAIALGVAGFLFVPLNEWGACYFFMVGAMIVSSASTKKSLQEAESDSTFEAPSEEVKRGASPERSKNLPLTDPMSSPEHFSSPQANSSAVSSSRLLVGPLPAERAERASSSPVYGAGPCRTNAKLSFDWRLGFRDIQIP